ncbi:fungal zn(2)-Cys(6) binuclear cluster domain-containing protein [Sarocladium implicatum]|nr:fungal zn(2)-Cys(6) binuclear cluster domain-containing protein [Sarocladium implicatum]
MVKPPTNGDADSTSPSGKQPKVRIANPCDGCTIRRVRCEAERPCHECRKRGIPCTTLRARHKRGPKGPRLETSRRVLEFQRNYAATHGPKAKRSNGPVDALGSDESTQATVAEGSRLMDLDLNLSNRSQSSSLNSSEPGWHGRLSLESYGVFLKLMRDRMQCIWPVVDYDDLIVKFADENAHDFHALAASVCAATIGQLRLPEHLGQQKRSLAHQFAQDSRSFRNQFDFMEDISVTSMLTSYFLHMYYVNAGKYSTAGFYMRECITYAQAMHLDRSETYDPLESHERSLKLRSYWLILITERTYCAQNRVPTILPTIDKLPPLDIDAGIDPMILAAFKSLVSLFACLRANITEVATAPSDEVFDMKRLMRYQMDLTVDPRSPGFDEAQCVDIFVTRQWIRLLIWEYTVRHFPLPYHGETPAFSLSFPVPVARELLGALSSVRNDSIVLHGWALELKVFRVADLLLDIMSLSAFWRSNDTMVIGAEDVVQSLSNVLLAVGGPDSAFLAQTRLRLGEFAVSKGSLVRSKLIETESKEDQNEDLLLEDSPLPDPTWD